MRLGWVQACSAHMWELCNRPSRMWNDSFTHPCLRRQDGRAFVQLRFSDPSQALALAWSPGDTPLAELVAAALHLGSVHAVLSLLLALPRQQAGGIPAEAEPADEIQLLEKRLGGAR